MSLALLFLAFFIGALMSIFNVLFARRELQGMECSTYLLGGALGGAFIAMCMFPVEDVSRWDIAIIALAGYFGADLLHAIIFNRSAR